MSSTFTSLSIPDYRKYLGAQFASSMAMWMQRVAQDWIVLQLSGSSGLAVGVVTALQFLPFLLVAPWAGVLADRMSRRGLLVITQSSLIALSTLMAVMTAMDLITIGWIYVLALLSGVAAAIDNPARQALLGDVVGHDRMVNAVGLNAMTFNLSRIAGPSVAGVLIALLGTWEVFSVTAALFAIAVMLLVSMRAVVEPHLDAVRVDRPSLRHGLTFVRKDSALTFSMLIIFVVATFGLNFQLTTALMSTVEFDGDAAAFGIMTTILSVGSLAGSLLAARRRRIRVRLVAASAGAFGLVELVTGTMPNRATYAVALVACGVMAMTATTSVQSFVQLRTPDHLRGRIMGIYTVLFFAGTPIGAPIIGWASDAFGPRIGLIGGGALTLAGTVVLTAWLLRRSRTALAH